MSADSVAELERLFAANAIHVERAGILEAMPSPAVLVGSTTPAHALADRVEGMLLGLAIGDALGNTTEGLTSQMRAMTYGEIRTYLPNPRARGRPIGLPTDDTQLAFWTLEQLLEDGSLLPDRLGARFCHDRTRIVGMGGTVAEFLHEHCENARPWHASGPRSAGNGALMRIAPVLVPHIPAPTPALWADVVLAAMLTHNDPAAIASCVAFTEVLWSCLGAAQPEEPEWWLDVFVAAMRPLEGDTGYRPRSLRYGYEGPIWEFADTVVRTALRHRLAVIDACEEWHSGAFLLETVPSVLYILCRHGHDPEQAIVRAVNDTTDNDTIGAIVGAAVGALHGRSKLPQRWIDGLSGRTLERDDGRVQELIAQAIARWVARVQDGAAAEH